MWGGATVFWQIDRNGNVRAGKIMGYNAETGHRVKEPFNQVSWVHSVRKVQDFRMKQCLFGEHLLSDTSSTISSKPVAIVESEKTALVAAHFYLTSSGLPPEECTGASTARPCRYWGGSEVILFPDLKATEEWRQRLPMLGSVCRRATCSDPVGEDCDRRTAQSGTGHSRLPADGGHAADDPCENDRTQSRVADLHRYLRT